MTNEHESLKWHRIGTVDDLPPGRVKTVTAGRVSIALTNIDGEFTAMDNRCPHQGGPLGEGSIEVGGVANAGYAVPGTVGISIRKPGGPPVAIRTRVKLCFLWKIGKTAFTSAYPKNRPMKPPSPM